MKTPSRPAKHSRFPPGVSWTEDAVVRVVEVTQGFPYFLQEFGSQAWDAADGPDIIDLGDVERSIPVATAELDDGFFRVRTGRTSDPERAYLRAMAELTPVPSGRARWPPSWARSRPPSVPPATAS